MRCWRNRGCRRKRAEALQRSLAQQRAGLEAKLAQAPGADRHHGDGYRRLMREMIEAQRSALVQLRNQGAIGDEVLHRIESQLDLDEARPPRSGRRLWKTASGACTLGLGLAVVGLAVGCRKAESAAAAAPGAQGVDGGGGAGLLPAEVPGCRGLGKGPPGRLRGGRGAGGHGARSAARWPFCTQESGFQVDPPVPGLADMVRTRLDEMASSLGPPGKTAVQALLAEHKPGDRRTFAQRLRALRTERDLDLLFRDMLVAAHAKHPVVYRAAALLDGVFRRARLEDLNPVGTAGSMQVGARWVLAHAPGQYADADAVRDALFTREGGLRWGVRGCGGTRPTTQPRCFASPTTTPASTPRATPPSNARSGV